MHPVFGKTESMFRRNAEDHTKVDPTFHPAFQVDGPWTASIKLDGSCGAILCIDGQWGLYRRQDITKKSRNYAAMSDRARGTRQMVAGYPCWVTSMVRGTGKHEKLVPLYVFDVDSEESIIGFTAIDPVEDKYVMSAVGSVEADPFVWVSDFQGSLDVPVVKRLDVPVVKRLDVPVVKRLDVPVVKRHMSEVAAGKEMVTVELMCRKFADHYGFTDDRCFVSVHGSMPIPPEFQPQWSYDGILTWFQSDNPWANQEGVVILTASGERFKIHRGHANMEHTWKATKAAGVRFHYTV